MVALRKGYMKAPDSEVGIRIATLGESDEHERKLLIILFISSNRGGEQVYVARIEPDNGAGTIESVAEEYQSSMVDQFCDRLKCVLKSHFENSEAIFLQILEPEEYSLAYGKGRHRFLCE